MAKYTRATDEALKESGIDPAWIVQDTDEEGPYAAMREPNSPCGHCGNPTSGWTVVNLQTATVIGHSWTSEDAEVDASEHAHTLNHAWLQGYAANERAAEHARLAAERAVAERRSGDAAREREMGRG